MSFLELSPAARRLRQAARAHAAGEMPRADYRRMRRAIIEELHVEFSDERHTFDRFNVQGDETRRRQPSNSEPVEEPAKVGLSRKILATLIVIVLGVALLASDSAFANSIPPVSERDPNPNNSKVLSVETIRLGNLPDSVELDRGEIQRLLDQWFAEARSAAISTGGHGFTDSELSEVGVLLQRLGAHNSTGLDQSAGVAIQSLLTRQKQRRGVTLQQVELIAEKLQTYIREQGFLAARAYLPAQEIFDRTAQVHVQLGRLGDLEITSETPLAELARRAFTPQLGQFANSSTLDRLFYQLNELPGVRAEGTLRAGREVGMTQLDLKLENQRRLVPALSFDNFGDSRSSRYRLNAALDWENPLRRGDALHLSLSPRFADNSSFAGTLGYESPVGRLGQSMRLTHAFENFSVDRQSGDVNGDSRTTELGFRKLLVGQREKSVALSATAAVTSLKLDGRRQRLWWVSPGVQAHRVFDESRWVLRADGFVTAGKISSGRFLDQSSGFVLGRGNLSAWHPIGRQSLRLELGGQLGTSDLPDSLKVTLGGNKHIYALPPSAFLADSVLFAGAEITLTPESFRALGEWALFSRLAHGRRSFGAEVDSAFAWEGGAVWRFAERHGVTGQLRLSFPLNTDGFEDSHDDARILLRLAWRP